MGLPARPGLRGRGAVLRHRLEPHGHRLRRPGRQAGAHRGHALHPRLAEERLPPGDLGPGQGDPEQPRPRRAVQRSKDLAEVRHRLIDLLTAAVDSALPDVKARMIQLEAKQAVSALAETMPADMLAALNLIPLSDRGRARCAARRPGAGQGDDLPAGGGPGHGRAPRRAAAVRPVRATGSSPGRSPRTSPTGCCTTASRSSCPPR